MKKLEVIGRLNDLSKVTDFFWLIFEASLLSHPFLSLCLSTPVPIKIRRVVFPGLPKDIITEEIVKYDYFISFTSKQKSRVGELCRLGVGAGKPVTSETAARIQVPSLFSQPFTKAHIFLIILFWTSFWEFIHSFTKIS